MGERPRPDIDQTREALRERGDREWLQEDEEESEEPRSDDDEDEDG